MNRSFPGKADGTQTERIAHVLSTELIASADFVFDVHSGDGAEWLEPFVGAWGGPLSTDYPTALAAAKAIGFPNVVRYAMFTQEQIDTGRSLNRQAVAQGLPTILIEIGQNGSRDEVHVQLLVGGIQNALASLGVLQSEVVTFPQPRTFESSKSVKAGHSGFWYPTRHGGPVKQGEIVGEIRNYQGEVVEVLRSPIDGYGIYGQMGPPIRKGDSAMTIGVPADIED
ncbi:MAG: succinylglutamate desuccinylase/aspartoacylase family protein [Pseudomonadota bacterium]